MDKVVEDSVKRARKGILDVMESVYREKVKPLQAEMYSCRTNCYRDSKLNMSKTSICVDKCMANESALKQLLATESRRMQQRFEQCSIDCTARLRHQIGKSDDASKYSGELCACVSKCAKDIVDSLPEFNKQLRKQIDDIK